MIIENLSESGMETLAKAALTGNMAGSSASIYLGLTSESVHILIAFAGLALSFASFCAHLYIQKKRLDMEKRRNNVE